MKKIFIVVGLTLVLLISVTSIYAQYMYKVAGRVTDSVTGEPLVGATVTCFGNALPIESKMTDVDGYYFFVGDNSIRKLKFSYIGYRDTTIQIKSPNQIINVELKPFADDLQ